MPGALYSRLKTWVSLEDLTAANLNAEFDNILNNLLPLMIDDYSVNTTQMQVQTDPGEVGTESPATTLGGELARLRFMLKEITGKTYWYQSPAASLAGLANAVGSGATDNRLVSGRVRTSSQQPIFLVPHGAARTVTVKGATTPFIYYVEGTEYQIDADVTVTNLTLAPSSNNTCLINDTIAADQDWTKYTGEDGSEIPVDTMGTEIQSLAGKLAAFKLDNGSVTEYFIAEVTSTTRLSKVKRGYFFDSSDNPKPRIVYSNNDTITLLKLTWIFAKSDETLTATYNPPSWSKDEPSSPSIGDYWFDTDNNKWKVYGVGSFSDADATLVGVCVQDTSNTIGARSFEFFLNYDSRGNVELMADTNTQVKSRYHGADINVWGSTIKNEHGLFAWDITSHLDSGIVEASSTYYFAYITEEGDRILSDIRPYDRREDLKGWYHPHHSWRCVGSAYNNGSSNFSVVNSYFYRYNAEDSMPAQTANANIETVSRVIPLDSSGGAFTQYLPPCALWKGQSIEFIKTSTADANGITIEGYGAETINGSTSKIMYAPYERLVLWSDGTSAYIRAWERARGQDISLHVHTGNGYGSTNTKIRRFTTAAANTLGVYATYADSAGDGGSVTIAIPGRWEVTVGEFDDNVNAEFGVTVNSAVLTTNIETVTYAQGRRLVTALIAANSCTATTTLQLAVGDVVRHHGDANSSINTNEGTMMRMVFLGI